MVVLELSFQKLCFRERLRDFERLSVKDETKIMESCWHVLTGWQKDFYGALKKLEKF